MFDNTILIYGVIKINYTLKTLKYKYNLEIIML